MAFKQTAQRVIIPAVVVAAVALGVPAVKIDEGRVLYTYRDIAGIATYCDGETEGAVMGMTYTDAECDRITADRFTEYAMRVHSLITTPVGAHELAAHTRLMYNIGPTAYANSTVLRRKNAGDALGACEAFRSWVCITVAEGKGDTSGQCKTARQHKKRVQGLANRREREVAMCLTPEPEIEVVAVAAPAVKPWWRFWG